MSTGSPKGPGHARVQLGGLTTRGQTAEQVKYAMALLTQMLHPIACTDKLQQKFGIGSLRAKSVLTRAKRCLAMTPPVDLEERREQMRAAFGLAYVECMAKGSHGPAVRALRELALLDGLYPASSLPGNLGGKDSEPESLANTDSDRVRARMAELMAKHAANLSTHLKPTPDGGTK